MCLAVYFAADRPLSTVTGPGLRVELLRTRRWPGDLFVGEKLYGVMSGCACDLLSDEADPEDGSKKDALLDQLLAYLHAVTEQGPIHALVCWGGDERKKAKDVSMSVAEFRTFDFDSAWDAPTRMTITSG